MDEAMVHPLLETSTLAIELAGVAVISLAVLLTTLRWGWDVAARTDRDAAWHRWRANLGRGILLGLEFLVAADIIGTVAVDPTLNSVLVLAGIVAIRTFLSFALEVEITGQWPWRHAGSGERPK